ncbi:MAG TPA: RNA polymerase factor sigma-54 [Alphaproteobacteria bacterium]|nr:RNA polymerase factor sigma-54 [Alphaproteobacteria bacterium]
MALNTGLALQQKQDVRLTAELREAIELLQLSAFDVQDLITQEIADNPCLEVEQDGSATDALLSQKGAETMHEGRAEAADLHTSDAAGERWEEVSHEGFAGPMGMAVGAGGFDDEAEGWQATAHKAQTLNEHLMQQFDAVVSPANRVLRVAGHYLIDALDDAGYLRIDLTEVAAKLRLPEDVIDDARAILQTLEPAGVGARDVAECLRLQLHAAKMLDHPTEVCLANLDKVAAKDWAYLAKLARCDEELIADAVENIRACTPKPGLAFAVVKVDAVLPDVIVDADPAGGWKVSLNGAAFPRLLVNALPLPMGKSSVAAAGRAWARDRTQRARWLVGALEQRAQTIMLVARAMVAKQAGFFDAGAEFLVPLSLRDIAREIGMHESTVSRVTTGTYMQTPRGVLPFRAFCASGVSSIGGQVGVASNSVQAMIKRLVAAENPASPLSDEQLVKLLTAEGVQVARRTVAKYREAANIPGSSARKIRRKAS